MPFQWWDYLDLAEEWIQGVRGKAASKVEFREARLRAVISRAYYACLLSTSTQLTETHGFRQPAHASHREIKLELMRHEKSVPAYKSVLVKLTNLQAARTIADYHATLPHGLDLHECAEDAIGDAMDLRSGLRAARQRR